MVRSIGRKGEQTLRALQYIESGDYTAIDLIAAFLIAPYGSSRSGFEYHARLIHGERIAANIRGGAREKAAARYYSLCSRLRKQGLMTEKGVRGPMRLTMKGRLKMKQLIVQLEDALPKPDAYVPAAGTQIVILAFDVPEHERRKRAWLREVLTHLGFRMKQQSLWIGKVTVPREFLLDLDKLGLSECVEIFAVTKTGSLRQIL